MQNNSTANEKDRKQIVTRSESPDISIAKHLLRFIGGRRDCVATDLGSGLRYYRRDAPLTFREIAKYHLSHQQVFAIYLLKPDNTVRSSCVDFDNHPDHPDREWKRKSIRLTSALKDWKLHPALEVSQSGSGSHIWLFFDKELPAWKVRSFWRGVSSFLKLNFSEVYPRQDSLKGKKLGNPIRIPLFNRSCFVDEKWRKLEPLPFLSNVKQVTAADLERVSKDLGFKLEPLVARRTPTQVGTDLKLPPSVAELLIDEGSLLSKRWHGDTDGLKDTSRSALVLSIACLLVYQYVPTNDIEAAIQYWAATHAYEKGEREDWVNGVLEKAYATAAITSAKRRLARSSNRSSVACKTFTLGQKPKGDANAKGK